jgi:hypothetical protein
MADRWEAWDAAESDRAHLVEGLAMAMYRHYYWRHPHEWAVCPYWIRDKYQREARALLDQFDITPKEKP